MRRIFEGFESGEYVPCNERVAKYVQDCFDKEITLYVDDLDRIWTEADEYLGDVQKTDIEL